ncbi:hypothetical protein SDAV_001863 [Spiroplasma phoeniceum P40]|uniref:Spiroplasma plectrovirus-related protein n=1 Tax=Spiroplasma phoeniceum P40 TaxID=1276259 RepID=A0A345DRG6_9MOLU|nr:hypothetical protein SDAV_001863 [Spiroplasma phoeniceum P40]
MVFSLYKNIYKFVNLLKIRIINLKVIIKIIISEIIVLIGNTYIDFLNYVIVDNNLKMFHQVYHKQLP